jgi:hypothetical protein
VKEIEDKYYTKKLYHGKEDRDKIDAALVIYLSTLYIYGPLRMAACSHHRSPIEIISLIYRPHNNNNTKSSSSSMSMMS